MSDLDARIRAWFMDNDRDDDESARNLAKTCDALSDVLNLCSAYKDKAETIGDPFPKVPVAQLRVVIARKLGVSTDDRS